MYIAIPVADTVKNLTGYPDCGTSCTFLANYGDIIDADFDNEQGSKTMVQFDLNFAGLSEKTISMYRCN